jgi:hypothetical protein
MPNPPPALANARNQLGAQRSALVAALYAEDQATQTLSEAERHFDANSPPVADAKIAKQNAINAANQARAAVTAASDALTLAIGDWLKPSSTSLDNLGRAREDIARLEASAPVVLFPVRIETRFEGAVLKVRVYPDEIFLNRHETALTTEEFAAGEKYYEDLNVEAASKEANWRDMVRRFGAQRSAYILRITLPTFDPPLPDGDPPPHDGIPAGQNLTLTFPTDIQFRAGSWTRPGEALLPDRWVVMTRRGNTRRYFLGNAIPEPLAMTVDPGASEAQNSTLPNGHPVDDRARWMIDFARAVQVGMGIQITLTGTEPQTGFDRVVVFGIKTSMTRIDGSLAIEKLLDAHHYTRGIALLRQGTATNNVKDRPTNVPPADDAGKASFAIERNTPLGEFDVGAPFDRFRAHPTLPPVNESSAVDGYFWTKLMGVPSGVLQNVDRAFERQWQAAQSMTQALWPVTYGFFLKFMMEPVFTESGIAKAKDYCLNFVFPRGFVPAFRVGNVPYGLLPVASLQRWEPRGLGRADDELVEQTLLPPLRRMTSIWKGAASGVPRVKKQSSQPELDLLTALSLFPSARDARIRFGLGPSLVYNAFNILGWDFAQALSIFDQKSTDLFQLMVGHPEWRTRIGRTVLSSTAFLATVPFVDLDKNLSETQAGLESALLGLFNATIAQLVSNTAPDKPSTTNLLYELLRISTITEYALQADALLRKTPPPGFLPWALDEVMDVTGLPSSSQSPVKRMLADATLAANARNASSGQRFAVSRLSHLPTAELDRLVRETLDLASHRLDAWVTAFATRRVFALRSLEESSQGPGNEFVPIGTFFGGYAWVEDLRPVSRTTAPAPDGAPAEVDPTNGGFVHCPSSRHAMAAAAMRSGFLTHSPESSQKFAFDLSSKQVRSAQQVLDEVRNGQHLGEVLGYRFERGLQDGHPGVAGLNALRFTFRNLFPLVAGKDGVPTSQPADRIAARNVVDGLALYRAYKAGTLQFTGNPLPSPGTTAHAAIIAELDNLGRMLDAVGDLLVGEGIFQLAGGNVHGALPSLRNLARGGRPPDPEIARSPRAGRGLAHRLAFVFQDPVPGLPAHWPSPTPRAAAEPALDAFFGNVLGDPQKVTATVTFVNPNQTTTKKSVTLAELDLRPLDFLALAHAALQPGQAGLLDQRLVVAAIGDDTTKTDVRVDHGHDATFDPKTQRTFVEAMELALALGGALGTSRPLALADLLSPSDLPTALPAAESSSEPNVVDLETRASDAATELDEQAGKVSTALANLDSTAPTLIALRLALRNAARVAPERAFVPSGAPATTVEEIAKALLQEFARRQARIAAIPGASSFGARIEAATNKIKIVFGSDFFVMPKMTPPGSGELKQALQAQSTLTDGDKRAPFRFVEQAWHARPQLAKVRKFALYARTLGAAIPRADVVQFPFVPGEKWLALPFADEPEESRVSSVLFSQAASLDPMNGTWRGIVLDAWTEVMPSKTQPTSLAFNYNGPRSEAPQCVLVVAPSRAGGQWQVEDVVASLEETLDLAKVRAVDRELLGAFAQVLPPAVLPTSLDPTVATSTGVLGPLGVLAPFFSQGFL